MAEAPGDRRNPLAAWQTLGLPVFASALAPWYKRLFEASLIPEWYEDSLTRVAMVIGPLVCFLLWMTCARLGRRRLVRLAYLALALFLLALGACLALSFTVDILWFPDETAQTILRLAWPAAYLAVFTGFSATIVCGLLLARGGKRSR